MQRVSLSLSLPPTHSCLTFFGPSFRDRTGTEKGSRPVKIFGGERHNPRSLLLQSSATVVQTSIGRCRGEAAQHCGRRDPDRDVSRCELGTAEQGRSLGAWTRSRERERERGSLCLHNLRRRFDSRDRRADLDYMLHSGARGERTSKRRSFEDEQSVTASHLATGRVATDATVRGWRLMQGRRDQCECCEERRLERDMDIPRSEAILTPLFGKFTTRAIFVHHHPLSYLISFDSVLPSLPTSFFSHFSLPRYLQRRFHRRIPPHDPPPQSSCNSSDVQSGSSTPSLAASLRLLLRLRPPRSRSLVQDRALALLSGTRDPILFGSSQSGGSP